jgi:hypothetical protein
VLAIASGVTTVRDPATIDVLDALVARFDAGTAIGPHVRLGTDRAGARHRRADHRDHARTRRQPPSTATATHIADQIYGAVAPRWCR